MANMDVNKKRVIQKRPLDAGNSSSVSTSTYSPNISNGGASKATTTQTTKRVSPSGGKTLAGSARGKRATASLQSDTDVGKSIGPLDASPNINWIPQNTGIVNTNTSYNGNYINNLDLSIDYQAKINDAVSKGDYYAAAQLEAARNAKINYLNSIGQNTGNYGTTTNYVNEYSSNNQGGVAYNPKYTYNDLKNNNLPNNWTEANIAGLRYKRDNNGTIYNYTGTNADTGQEQWVAKGNYINPNTGEWAFNDRDVAAQAARDTYARATGDYGYIPSDAYVNMMQNGTYGTYSQLLQALLANQDRHRDNRGNYYSANDDGWVTSYGKNGTVSTYNQWLDSKNLDPNTRQILHVNSFESDAVNGNDYHDYVKNQGNRAKYSLW